MSENETSEANASEANVSETNVSETNVSETNVSETNDLDLDELDEVLDDAEVLELLESIDGDDEILQADTDESESEEPQLVERSVSRPIAEPIPPPPPADDIQTAVANLARTFSDTATDVLNRSTEDRAQLQEAIEHLGGIVNQPGRVPNVIVEQWVAAMSKKAEINISTTKLLDSIARLLSAAKNNTLISGSSVEDDINFEEVLGDDEVLGDG